MAKKLPIVAIVGRANVGKSSLFNTILERREAIVAQEAGTTRDSIMAKASVWVNDGPTKTTQDAPETLDDDIGTVTESEADAFDIRAHRSIKRDSRGRHTTDT